MTTRRWISACLAIIVLTVPFGCGDDSTNGPRSLASRADEVLDVLYARDWDAFAEIVHPERGVLLSPSAFVDRAEAVTFYPSDVLAMPHADSVRVWGYEDGSGEPIEMTAAEFFAEHLLDRDFRDARKGARDEVLGSGNTINNVPEVFHDSRDGADEGREIAFIEYHDEGTEAFGGMDWASLRLVFERVEGEWLLIGIVRDAWSI